MKDKNRTSVEVPAKMAAVNDARDPHDVNDAIENAMELGRSILVPCSLTSDTAAARGTRPYLTAKAPSGPLPDPVAGSS